MKNRVKVVSTLVAAMLSVGATVALAEESLAPPQQHPAQADKGACPPAEVTGDVYAGPVNKYVFRGNDFSGGKWVMQGGINLYYKDLTFGYWTNYQGRSVGEDYPRGVNETDIFLEYAFKPSELFSLTVGNVLYDTEALTTNELYLKGTLNTLLSPTLAAYWDWHKASDDGLFYSACVSHEFAISDQMALSVGALAGYNQHNNNTSAGLEDDFDGGYSGFHNYELTATLDYKPTANLTITPNYLFSDALSDKAEDIAGIEREHVFGVKATLCF